jgi:hypothetical protein
MRLTRFSDTTDLDFYLNPNIQTISVSADLKTRDISDAA